MLCLKRLLDEGEPLGQCLGVAHGGGFDLAPRLLDGQLDHVLLFLKSGSANRRGFSAGHVGRAGRKRISGTTAPRAANKPDTGEQACPQKLETRV